MAESSLTTGSSDLERPCPLGRSCAQSGLMAVIVGLRESEYGIVYIS